MAEETKFWYLNHFNLFDGMDESAMKELNRMSSMSDVKQNQPIYFPDEPSHTIFLLKKGHVKISRLNPDGKEVILEIIGPGEIFGELAFLEEGAQRSEIAQALDDVVICAVKEEDFEKLMMKNPELNFRVTKRIGLRMKKFEERVTDLVFKDVRRRLASFLVDYAEEFGKMKRGVVTIKMHLSHQEIAFLTGSARQTVTTTLNEFRSGGLIDFSREGITIRQFETLQQMAK
jgi:CRP/FNR family transcriptional regulator, cyclic AMP receptor protein